MEPFQRRIDRRTMLTATAKTCATAAVATGLGSLMAGEAASQPAPDCVWDAHGHLSGVGGTPQQQITQLLEYADRLGIERVVVSMGYPFSADPSPEEVRRQNDQVLEAVRHSQGRAFGLAYVNPKHTDESLKELDRCVGEGPMVGVKLWIAIRCKDPCLDPIVERAISLKAPILQHTWLKATGNAPGESTPGDLAELAARHPRASFIGAHVGGDWEIGIRAIRPAGNVAAEICGSDPTAGMVEMAVRELGARRVIYGSDFGGRSFASQLAKVYGAEIPREAQRLILAGNLQRMLQPILKAKGITL